MAIKLNQNTGVNVIDPNKPVLPENATAMDTNRFLYDTRLQNVFNDYQQSMASLNQQQQQSLQDAYFIREMSKKYLGEYASNIGIGDVSGNLLDVYSNYQQSVASIQQNTAQLQMNLQQAYDQQSRAAFETALAGQIEAQQMQLDENAQTVLFNISQGNMGSRDWKRYLESQLQSGQISQQAYQSIYTSVYTAKYDEVEANIQRGFYGFKTDADGNRVPLSAQEYLEQNASWLNPSDYAQLKNILSLPSDTMSLASVDTPQYLKYFGLGGEHTIELSMNGNTLLYTSASVDVDSDTNAKIQVSTEDLTDAFQEENPNDVLISGQTLFEYKGNYYYYVETPTQGGTWYRMINATSTKNVYDDMMANINGEEGQSTWKKQGSLTKITNKYFTYDLNADTLKVTGGGTFTYDDAYEYHGKSILNDNFGGNEELNGVRDKFITVHGGGYFDSATTNEPKNGWASLKNTVVFHNGYFYTITWDGKLRRMSKLAS